MKYFGVLREIVGRREESVDVAESITLLDLLRLLTVRHGSSMKSYIFDENANVPRPIHLYLVNGKTFSASQISTVALDEESVVSIIPTQGG